MTKNPYLHALLAAAYIVILVSGANLFGKSIPDNTLLIPIAMLSLFVLSAAVMGYLFVYTPAQLFLDNQREKASVFFLKTVGTFACFVGVFVLLLLLL